MTSTNTNMFQFVMIPAESENPMETIELDGSGGLTNDALVAHVKDYFYRATGAQARVETLNQASPQEREQIAAQIKQQLGTNAPPHMDNDALLDLLHRNQSQASCDITAITVPTPTNGHTAVSLYAADQAKEHGWPLNVRAMALVAACGYPQSQFFGNVFVGRALDHETADIWKRIDFTPEDTSPQADWVRVARSPGGGGGRGGGSSASSLSGILQQQQQQAGGAAAPPPIQIQNHQNATEITSQYGLDGGPPVVESWGTWTQSNPEVELCLQVPAGTKSKQVQVQFGRTTLSIQVHDQVVLQKSKLFDPIVPDDSTYTLQDSKDEDHRELCITLTKAHANVTWTWVVEASSS